MDTIAREVRTDVTAIEAIENERARQRQDLVDATCAAKKRDSLLRAGLGFGAAAFGIGLAALLVCFGLSLIWGQPSRDQLLAALAERSSLSLNAADQRLRDIQEHAARSLAAVERKLSEQTQLTQAAEQRARAAQALVSAMQVPASSKTVTDFTVFQRQEVGDINVVTGWKYRTINDMSPSFQYCHMYKSSSRDGLQLAIARDGEAIEFDAATARKVGVTWSDVQSALAHCRWFRGENPNIRENGSGAT
jgi:hypothetical protein